MDLRQFFADYQDHLAPKLDCYEQAIYLYVFRHSRLIDVEEVVIGFKSARTKMSLGKGSYMSEKTCYDNLESLVAKGYLERLGLRQEARKITPEGFEKKSIIVPTPEASTKGAKDETEENVWFYRGIDYARTQRCGV